MNYSLKHTEKKDKAIYASETATTVPVGKEKRIGFHSNQSSKKMKEAKNKEETTQKSLDVADDKMLNDGEATKTTKQQDLKISEAIPKEHVTTKIKNSWSDTISNNGDKKADAVNNMDAKKKEDKKGSTDIYPNDAPAISNNIEPSTIKQRLYTFFASSTTNNGDSGGSNDNDESVSVDNSADISEDNDESFSRDSADKDSYKSMCFIIKFPVCLKFLKIEKLIDSIITHLTRV